MYTIHIKSLLPKTLAGIHLTSSLANNRTPELWRSFMPIRKQLQPSDEILYALQVYPADYFKSFNPETTFEKWALVEVQTDQTIEHPFERFNLDGGMYAVIQYQGLPGNPAVFEYFFSKWLPASRYELDDRPHFEVLGENYKNGDPTSEEEIWIPVKERL